MMRQLALALGFLLPCCAAAQMPAGEMKKPAAAPSASLTVTLLDGTTTSYLPEQFKALTHVSVSVHNAHNNQDESYSGVPVDTLVNPPVLNGPSHNPEHVSPNVQVIMAGATDNFHVVITLCDTNPQCRSGQAIVADTLDGKPLTTDGAFKLVLTEDKKPARWVRNLQSLTVRAVDAK